MKITKKVIISIILIAVMTTVLSLISNVSYAGELMTEVFEKGETFISSGKSGNGINNSQIVSIFLPVGKLLVAIADAVLIVVTGIMGIQYITASPDKKAKLKQQLIGLVVSIVVVHGAVAIWQTVKTFMEGF